MITGSRGAYNERRVGIDTRVVIKYIPDDLLFVTSALAGKEKRKKCERERKKAIEKERERERVESIRCRSAPLSDVALFE